MKEHDRIRGKEERTSRNEMFIEIFFFNDWIKLLSRKLMNQKMICSNHPECRAEVRMENTRMVRRYGKQYEKVQHVSI